MRSDGLFVSTATCSNPADWSAEQIDEASSLKNHVSEGGSPFDGKTGRVSRVQIQFFVRVALALGSSSIALNRTAMEEKSIELGWGCFSRRIATRPGFLFPLLGISSPEVGESET
jgi:hypothetical protein